MTSPMVDVRNIPLVVEKDVCVPPGDESNEQDSGFPFDREFDRETRDDSLRSQLDDIAKRHPEFAEHLEGFGSLGRRSRPPRPSEESDFRRFTGRPFGSSRFERFGFPFGRDPFDDDYDRFEEQRPAQPDPPQPKQEQEQTPPKQNQEEQKRDRGRKQNIQQSNTVDLGQKQEPVNDRNQRSMSAPPPDNRSQQRYVSSINIPIGGMGDMGAKQSQSQPQQEKQATNKPTERVIPIHVEGRDEPVMPKHTGPCFSQPQPQPEKIFTQRPMFAGTRQFSAGPEWHHPGFTQPPPQQQQQKFQQQSPPPQQQKFQQQKPVEEEVPQPQQPPKSANNPIEIIQSIQKDVSELMGQVEKFAGVPRDKQYLYLDEMLTRNLIKLDNIDTQGQENIRQARKEAIKCIEGCIGILEAKAAANVPQEKQPEETPQTEEAQPEVINQESQPVEERMDVEAKPSEPPAPEEAKTEEKQEKMDDAPIALPEPPKEAQEEKTSEPSAESQVEEVKPAAEDNNPENEAAMDLSQDEKKDEEGDDKKEKKKEKKKKVVKK